MPSAPTFWSPKMPSFQVGMPRSVSAWASLVGQFFARAPANPVAPLPFVPAPAPTVVESPVTRMRDRLPLSALANALRKARRLALFLHTNAGSDSDTSQ